MLRRETTMEDLLRNAILRNICAVANFFEERNLQAETECAAASQKITPQHPEQQHQIVKKIYTLPAYICGPLQLYIMSQRRRMVPPMQLGFGYCNANTLYDFVENSDYMGLDEKPNFVKFNKYTMGFEGGWVNDPADSGGATNRGITFSNFKKWARPDLDVAPIIDNLKTLTYAQATTLYRIHYWNRIHGDEFLSGKVAFAVYDFSVNSGAGVKETEKVFARVFTGITIDGILTSREIAIVNNGNAGQIFEMIQSHRLQYMQSIIDRSIANYKKKHPNASQKELMKNTSLRFKNGWTKRVNDISKMYR